MWRELISLPREIRQYHAARRSLEQAAALLPGDTPDAQEGEYCLAHFREYISHNEIGLAPDVLLYIASCYEDRGVELEPPFWERLSEACELIGGEDVREVRAELQRRLTRAPKPKPGDP